MQNGICTETGKIIYKTKREAWNKKSTLRNKRRHYHTEIYECNFCGGWHLSKAKHDYSEPRGLHKKGR